MLKTRTIALASLLAFSSLTSLAQAATERFTVLAVGEKVGQLVAETSPGAVTLDYSVVNNGRGPKTHEVMALDAAGLPTSWTIDGQSLFGGAVHERFAWKAGKASWTSQADQGVVRTPAPRLYAGNDGSPWILGLYARKLLQAPAATLPILPSGQMRLEILRTLTVGDGAQAVKLTLYALDGVNLHPSYLALDAQGQLFSVIDEGLIREGYEAQLPILTQIREELDLTRSREAQTKLAHHFTGPVRIRNVRVFDPVSMSVSGPSAVTVFGDKIVTVESDDPKRPVQPDETVIDGQGGMLVPGLHDMHSHTTLDSNLFNLAAGVTATRDQGNRNERLAPWMAELAAGTLAGPRIVPNGFIEGRSPYSAREGMVADTLDQALEDVRWYAEHGYWQIKIYNSVPPDWVKPIAAEAHRLGMGVTGHVPAFTTPDRVLSEGYNDIAHVNQLMLGWLLQPGEDTRTPLRLTAMTRAGDLDLSSPRVTHTLALMKEKHAALDTTDMILERLMLSRAGQVQEGDAPYLDHTPIGYQRFRKRTFAPVKAAADDAAYQAGFAKTLQVMKLLDDNGIQLLPGTDDTTGFSLHRELELYVKAGLTPAKALRLATYDAERYFHRDQTLGTVERGKLADFILVAGDPTKDIRQIRRVRMTVRGGVVYYPSEIYQFLGVTPFEAAPPVTPAASTGAAQK
jgi:hypothetical protein